MSTVLHCHSHPACARAERELPLKCVVYLLTPNLWLRRALVFWHCGICVMRSKPEGMRRASRLSSASERSALRRDARLLPGQ